MINDTERIVLLLHNLFQLSQMLFFCTYIFNNGPSSPCQANGVFTLLNLGWEDENDRYLLVYMIEKYICSPRRECQLASFSYFYLMVL